jgi:hypothetical protein
LTIRLQVVKTRTAHEGASGKRGRVTGSRTVSLDIF